jgi:hypothetical protein
MMRCSGWIHSFAKVDGLLQGGVDDRAERHPLPVSVREGERDVPSARHLGVVVDGDAFRGVVR